VVVDTARWQRRAGCRHRLGIPAEHRPGRPSDLVPVTPEQGAIMSHSPRPELSRRGLLRGLVLGGASAALPLDLLRHGRPAAAATATGASVGPYYRYNTSANHWFYGDTFGNCWADDDKIYMNCDDSKGLQNQYAPAGRNFWLGVLPESPTTNPITVVNGMSVYGAQNGLTTDPDGVGRAWKAGAMYCQDGVLYMDVHKVRYGVPQTTGASGIIKSTDHGQNWTDHLGNVNTPPPVDGTAMFPIDGPSFTPYFIEHGKNGAPGPSAVKADTYVYATGVEQWNNGNYMRIGRVPRASIMTKSAWQFYKGPTDPTTSDGLSDANWGSLSSAKAIFRAPGRTNFAEVRYVPGLNKYLFFNYYYTGEPPTGTYGNTAAMQWAFFQSDTPWGPWQLFYTKYWATEGFYIPTAPSKWMAPDGSSMWLLTAGDFSTDSLPYDTTLYSMFLLQLTVNTGGSLPNKLTNPSFTSGSTGWSTSGAAVSTGSGRQGSSAMRIAGGSKGFWQTVTGLSPNTSYHVGGWIRASSGATGGYLFAKDYGSSQVVTQTITGSEWNWVGLRFKTGSGATSAVVGGWQDGGSVAVDFDDLTVLPT
jgi:hypothetical protein